MKRHQVRVVTLIFLFLSVTSRADEPIVMVYHERTPYVYFDENNQMQGLVGAPVRTAFEQANVQLSWSEIPPNRQLQMIRNNQSPTCSLGWFKNDEREVYAQFSASVYQDHPTIGLAKKSNTAVPDKTTIGDLFQQDGLTLLTKAGYSYGTTIDKLITELEPNRIAVTVENTSMLKMLAAGRVDYFFLASEEAEQLILSQGYQVDDFKYVDITDIPPGENRYVICNEFVSTEIMQKINAWLVNHPR